MHTFWQALIQLVLFGASSHYIAAQKALFKKINKQNNMTHLNSKPHYALLDGLRGVAALLVVWYHIFEGFQFASGAPL